MIIDFHTHAFPDALAPRALERICQIALQKISPRTDGTVAGLLRSMRAAGIDRSVLACIVTKPDQFQPILDWCRQLAGTRLVPFPSVHPADPRAPSQVDAIAAAGFHGIKLHPHYQGFHIDDEVCLPIYRRLAANRLILLCHAGQDIAFPEGDQAAPARIRRVLELVPELIFVAPHCGGWHSWDEVERELLGGPAYLDLSHVFGYLDAERLRRLILAHDPARVLFGSDSPWVDQAQALAQVRALQLPSDLEAAVLGGNAARLLQA